MDKEYDFKEIEGLRISINLTLGEASQLYAAAMTTINGISGQRREDLQKTAEQFSTQMHTELRKRLGSGMIK